MNKKSIFSYQCTTTPILSEINRKWYIINLKEIHISNITTKIVNLLRGKNNVNFFPNFDLGNFVVLINSKFVDFSKKKLENNFIYHHSGYSGGLKKKSWGFLLKSNPSLLIYNIIKGMMPHNKMSNKQLKRLFVYPENHNLYAQKKLFIDVD